ncbi:MAG: polysaccharide biosynthesis tyrosine autokinase [Bacteroidales bacterium]|nr:polysaccharide biosynthesis tyrosine autokinase [Bacteroidales bacterium]
MEQNNKAQSINIFSIIRIFLSYWPVLALSSFLFLTVGLFIFKYSSRTYRVYARIIIDTHRESVAGGSSQYINVNDLMNQQKSFTNEVTYLRSSPLIKEVIEDMKLQTSYYLQEDIIPKQFQFSLQNIYKNSPFFVIIDEESLQPINSLFYVQILDEKHFILFNQSEQTYIYDFKTETELAGTYPYYINGKFKFGETIKTKYSSFKVLLNSNYNPERFRGKDLFFKLNSSQYLAYEFEEALSVSSAFYESSIANLTFDYSNVELAKEFLTNLINKYIEKNLDKKNFIANNTIDYIEQQLANAYGSLGQSEQRLQNFRTARDVINIDQKTSNLFGQIQELERTREGLLTQIDNLRSLYNYFVENENASTFIVPANLGMSDATLATLIQELTTLSREKQDLVSTDQLKNPRIKTLDANMATIRKVITDNINYSTLTLQNELRDINNRISRLQGDYSRLPETQRQLLELEREFQINDEVYSTLLNQRIQAKIMKASNRPDVEVIEPVRFFEMTAPSFKKIAAIAVFLGLLFPSLYIIIVNFLSPKIRTREEIGKFCHLASIGDIPHSEKENQPDVINSQPQAPITERFHFLRTNIIYYLFGKTNKAILVTSTLPSEGKSFTSLNLALSFASANFKTLLIAFDLRKNSKTLNELKVNSLVGLDAYLIEQAGIEDIIAETPYPNLHFISNGKIPPNPSALITSPNIKELFEVVKPLYDYIIIDTPPFGLVTDAFMLMQYADINLYVARIGTVTKKALKQSMDEVKMKNIQNIYLVQNDLTKIDKPYYGKYTYAEKKKKSFWGFLKPKK